MIAKILETRPRIDAALSALDKNRLKLPVLDLRQYFPDFSIKPVIFCEVPTGPWSSPVADVLMLLKIVACLAPLRAMEVGSYRGYTALGIARHMPEGGKLVTLDSYLEHGEAYIDTPYALKIERRVGALTRDAIEADALQSYSFIFLDAGHRYHDVKHDTQLLLPLLAPTGMFVWHDYANWGRFNKLNGVPEFLHELSATLPVARISGTGMGLHSPAWSGSMRATYLAALENLSDPGLRDPWRTTSARG